jgi:hypothetical protein
MQNMVIFAVGVEGGAKIHPIFTQFQSIRGVRRLWRQFNLQDASKSKRESAKKYRLLSASFLDRGNFLLCFVQLII